MQWQIFIGHRSAWFPLLLSACRLVEFDTTVICRNLPCVYALFRLISIARYAFKSPRICFRGTKYEINREHVAYLHSIFFAGPGSASSVGRSLSRITYFVLARLSSEMP